MEFPNLGGGAEQRTYLRKYGKIISKFDKYCKLIDPRSSMILKLKNHKENYTMTHQNQIFKSSDKEKNLKASRAKDLYRGIQIKMIASVLGIILGRRQCSNIFKIL